MCWIFSNSALKQEENLGPTANSWQPPTPDGVKIDPLQVAHAGNIPRAVCLICLWMWSLDQNSIFHPVVFLFFAALPDDSYPVMVVSVRMDGSDGGDSERTKSQQHWRIAQKGQRAGEAWGGRCLLSFRNILKMGEKIMWHETYDIRFKERKTSTCIRSWMNSPE